jgi:pantetheine-phosphate adenylyltransferase
MVAGIVREGSATMWQDRFIGDITRSLEHDPDLQALFLAGSFGSGAADVHSDVDLLAVVAREDQDRFARDWRQRVEAIVPTVYWNEIPGPSRVINAIGQDWQRIDLVLADRDALSRRGRDSLKPLLDRDALHEGLPAAIPWPGPDKRRVAWLISEFLRVLGLLPVAIGRKEYLTGLAGLELLRTGLFHLLSEEVERADKGGMLAWSRRLSASQLALLATIPVAAPDRRSLIDAHLAAASAFLPHARGLAQRWGIDWPEAFETATWAHLETTLGIDRAARVQTRAAGETRRGSHAGTKALYAGSFDPITRGHLDVIGKALATFDVVHVAIGTNPRKTRSFDVAQSLRLIADSIAEQGPPATIEGTGPALASFGDALEIGEFTGQSLVAYARSIGATHIVRGLREASDFNEEFNLHGVAGRIDPTLPMVHFICDAPYLHVSSSTARELAAVGENIDWLVTPSVARAFSAQADIDRPYALPYGP